MTSDERKEILKNMDQVLKDLATAEENTRVGLEAALKLDPRYEHRAVHEDALKQMTSRREEMLKLRKQVEDLPIQG